MAEETQAPKEKKNVYISLHKAFVHENIKYTDKKTGQEKTFNVVRLPADTVIDGKDVGGYEFSPLYVNPSKFRGEDWRDIPLLADREVRLQKSVLDAEGKPVLGEDGQAPEGDADGEAPGDQDGARRGPQALRRGARQGRPQPRRAGRGGEGGLKRPGEGRCEPPFGP